MLIIIPPYQHCQNRLIIEESFKVRYEVFIEELGWKIPGVQKGIEKDQFDTPQTYYLVKLDEDGKVIAGARFLSTDSNFLLKDIFPDLVDESHKDLLNNPEYWEFSRLYISKRFRQQSSRSKVRSVLCELLLGALSFGHHKGIKGYLVVVDTRIKELYKNMGWPLTSLGAEKEDGNTSILAATMLVKREFYNQGLQNYKHYSGDTKEEFISNVQVLKGNALKKARL